MHARMHADMHAHNAYAHTYMHCTQNTHMNNTHTDFISLQQTLTGHGNKVLCAKFLEETKVVSYQKHIHDDNILVSSHYR